MHAGYLHNRYSTGSIYIMCLVFSTYLSVVDSDWIGRPKLVPYLNLRHLDIIWTLKFRLQQVGVAEASSHSTTRSSQQQQSELLLASQLELQLAIASQLATRSYFSEQQVVASSERLLASYFSQGWLARSLLVLEYWSTQQYLLLACSSYKQEFYNCTLSAKRAESGVQILSSTPSQLVAATSRSSTTTLSAKRVKSGVQIKIMNILRSTVLEFHIGRENLSTEYYSEQLASIASQLELVVATRATRVLGVPESYEQSMGAATICRRIQKNYEEPILLQPILY